VIELQEQFGNKWAKIATYLEGRTDNDVKNFWSGRRKRMERTFPRTSSPPSKQQKNKGKVLLNEVKVHKVRWILDRVLCVVLCSYSFLKGINHKYYCVFFIVIRPC